MFPFSSILEGVDRGLFLPSTTVESVFGGWGNFATAGFRFATDGDYDKRRFSTYTPVTNAWVHEDTKPTVDSTQFEVMVDNVDTSQLGDGSWFDAAAEGVWVALTFDRQWRVFISGTEFEGFKEGIVTGTCHIREIAIPSNTASSNFTLTVQYEGQS